MGMSAYHLFTDPVNHIFDSEIPVFFSYLCMHDDLKQQISQLFLKVLRITGLRQYVYAAYGLCSLFYAWRLKALMGLFPVPGAAILCTQTPHHLDQFIKCFQTFSPPLIKTIQDILQPSLLRVK